MEQPRVKKPLTLKDVAQGMLTLIFFGGLYIYGQAKKEIENADYVESSSSDRRDVHFEGYKQIRFKTGLKDFVAHPPCRLIPATSEEPSVVVYGCTGNHLAEGSDGIGFYFIGGELLRVSLVFKESQSAALAKELVKKYGTPWKSPTEKLFATAQATNGTIDYIWGKNNELVLRGGNAAALVIYSAREYQSRLESERHAELRGSL